MNMIEDFEVVGASDLVSFETMVKDRIKKGMQPYGNIFYIDGMLSIAMVKYNPGPVYLGTSQPINWSELGQTLCGGITNSCPIVNPVKPINTNNTVIQNMIDDLTSFKKKYDDFQYFTPCTSSSDIPSIKMNFQEEVKFVLNKSSESIVYLIDRMLELNIPIGEPSID